MADYLIKDTTLESIADAIREKRGISEDIFTEDFADEIMQISGGGGEEILDWQMPILNSDVSIKDGIVYSVMADSVLSATVNQSYKAFDGDSTTYWHSAGSVVNQHYLKLFASSPVKITHIDYQNVVDSSPVFLQSFSLYGSNDDSDYTLIGTYTVHPNTSTLDSIDVDNDNFYTSYRFDCVPVGILGGQYYSVIADMGLSGQIKKNASSGDSDIIVDTVFNPLTGSNSYTVEESGRYLVAVGCCHNGQASITLPEGRVPIVNETNESIITGTSRRITINIVDLEVGDVVNTANAYTGQWTGSFAVISKLKGFDNVTFLSKSKVDDAQTTLTVPSDSNTYGIISFTVGSNLASSWTKAKPHNSENAFMQILDSNATMYVWKGKGTDFPTVTQYGYNGGMVGSFVLEF